MAYDLDDIYTASYRDVVFIVDSTSIDGGRKIVKHEYVNSDKQTLEDLGLKRRTYKINAIVTGTDYELRRNNMFIILEDGGKGDLIHPFLGTIEDMVVKSFTYSENFKDFGLSTFSIIFEPSDKISSPEKSETTIAEVQAQLEVLEKVIQDDINFNYKTTTSLTGSIDSSINKLSGFIDTFAQDIRGVGGIVSTINSLNSQILNFENSVAALVQVPLDLSASVNSLFVTANSAYQSSATMLLSMVSMFNFGSDDREQLEISTAANNEINRNDDIINNAINSYSLGNAYEQLVSTKLGTIEEIEYAEKLLQDQFELVVNANGLSNEVRDELTLLRTITSEVITITKTTTPELIDIETPALISLRKLEFLYYNENERTGELVSINSIKNISFVTGDLEFLNDNI